MDFLKYDEVEGVTALKQQLLSYLHQFELDNEINTKSYYILFRQGAQQSVIRVDVEHPHCYFWYFDLLGRPMTQNVKRALAEFLWEHNGQKKAYISAMCNSTTELV